MALDEAKAKFEAAQSEVDWQEGQRLAQDVLRLAGSELAAARRRGDAAAKLSALELEVQANIHVGDSIAASLAANDEVAMIRRIGDKASEASALQLLAEVQVTRGDTVGASESLQSAASLAREVGAKEVLAKALRSLSLALMAAGKKNEALAPAEEALKLYGELGNSDGEAQARRAVNTIYVEKGQTEQAPSRPEAIAALKELGDAVAARDTAGWAAAMERLNRTCAYSQKDVDDVVEGALEKDRAVASVFLEEQGVATRGHGEPGRHVKEVAKTVHYLAFRLSGLAYGPRFRCANPYKTQVGEDMETLHALACLQVSDEAEDWEAELQYHPGVLDCVLQSGNAYFA